MDDEAFLRMEPEQKRERIFAALRELFVRESQKKPLLLAIEDLHWIDRTSEAFIDYLIRWIENTRILLILLYRPEYNHKWVAKAYHNKIFLEGLPTKASTELLHGILKDGVAAPELKELILGKAEGNPLFMEELTQSLMENGCIQRTGHQYALTTELTAQVPDTVQGIIAARIDRVERNLKRIMQVLSVVGSEFAFRILRPVVELKEKLDSFALSFDELAFIQEKSFFPELEYVFKHALIQEVTYKSLLTIKRKELHGKIARAIEALYPDRLEEYYEVLAYHYSRGDDPERAYRYLKLSGEKASRNYSLWEAFHYYREAIKKLKQLPATRQNKREQIKVRLLISIPILLLGYPEDSLRILQEGERQSKAIGDERSALVFRSKLGHYYAIKGEPLLAVKYTEHPYRRAREIQDIELMAPIACELCSSYFVAGDFYKIVDVAPEILAFLEKTHRERDFFGTRYNVYSGLCGHYAYSLGMLGNFEKGKDLCRKGLHFALGVDNRYSLGWMEFSYGVLFLNMGDGKNGFEHLRESIKHIEEARALYMLGPTWAWLGYGNYLKGDLITAQSYIEKGLKIHGETGLTLWLALHFCLLGMVHFESGDLKNAQSSIEEAIRLSQENNERQWEANSRMWLGRIIGRKQPSQCDKAEEHILQGMRVLQDLRLKPYLAQGYLFLGELHAETAQKERASENLGEAERMFHEMGMEYWTTRTRRVLGGL